MKRESAHWDLLGRQGDDVVRDRLAHAGLTFDAPGRELRLAVYDGDRKPWWVRIAPDGSLLSIVWTVPEGMPAGHWTDPIAALEVALEAMPGRLGFIEHVEHRTITAGRAPLGALGRIDGTPWELELSASGLLRVTGSAARFAGELAAVPDLVAHLTQWPEAGLIALTEVPAGGDGSPPLVPARGPEIPDGAPPSAFPERAAAPGKEILLAGHERGSRRWALRVLADGRIAAAEGSTDPLPVAELGPDVDPLGWASQWPGYGYPDFWLGDKEIIRWEVPAPGLPLTVDVGWLGAVEISAGGAVAVCGDQAREIADALVAAGIGTAPLETLRALPRLVKHADPAPGVLVTVGKCITPYTSTL